MLNFLTFLPMAATLLGSLIRPSKEELTSMTFLSMASFLSAGYTLNQCSTTVYIARNFRGRKLPRILLCVYQQKNSLSVLGSMVNNRQYKRTIRDSFLYKIAKVFSLERFAIIIHALSSTTVHPDSFMYMYMYSRTLLWLELINIIAYPI